MNLDPQSFLNILFWETIRKNGGSVTFTKEELKGIKSDEVGCIQVTYEEDDAVKLTSVDLETLKAYQESFNSEQH